MVKAFYTERVESIERVNSSERTIMHNNQKLVGDTFRKKMLLVVFALAPFVHILCLTAGEGQEIVKQDAKKKMHSAQDKARQAASEAKDGTRKGCQVLKEEGKDGVRQVKGKVQGKVADSAETVEEKADELKNEAQDRVARAKSDVKDLSRKSSQKYGQAQEKGREVMSEAADVAQEKGKDLKNKVRDGAREVGDKAKSAVQTGKAKCRDAQGKVQEVASNVAETVQEKGKAAKDKTQAVASDVADKVKDVAQKGKEKLYDAKDKVQEKYHEVVHPDHGPAHEFELPDDDGGVIDLSAYKGMVVLLVNIPARSEAVSYLEELEGLYQRYARRGLIVIAVSSNDFMANAEPCVVPVDGTVHTTYPRTALVHVKDKQGSYEACPLYRWLNGQTFFRIGSVGGDFHKFLIGRDGTFVDWFAEKTPVTGKKVTRAIEKALAAE